MTRIRAALARQGVMGRAQDRWSGKSMGLEGKLMGRDCGIYKQKASCDLYDDMSKPANRRCEWDTSGAVEYCKRKGIPATPANVALVKSSVPAAPTSPGGVPVAPSMRPSMSYW